MAQAAANIDAARRALLQISKDNSLAQPPQDWVLINLTEQSLHHLSAEGEVLACYPVSTALKGAGNQQDSLQTPLGLHRVAEKIGDGCASGEIFKGRKSIAECAVIETRALSTGFDYITSRILWLQGLEPGLNQGGAVDSYARYIYIHGTHEEGLVGQPASIGCIRMRNQDVIGLYSQIAIDSWVYIVE